MEAAVTRRARDAVAKGARREALLDGLEALFREIPYERITVALVAERCGLAKGTVYLYFPTREAMFLALYLRHATAFAEVLTALVERTRSAATLGAKIARGLAGDPTFLRLMALAPTVLERNVDVATAASFKRDLLRALAPVAEALERRVPGFVAGDGLRFLLRLNALAVGFSEMANPSPVVAEAIATDPALRPLRINFGAELASALAALLRGSGDAARDQHSRR